MSDAITVTIIHDTSRSLLALYMALLYNEYDVLFGLSMLARYVELLEN